MTRGAILAQAGPIILSQASIPLVGIVDAAVIGRTGDETALAAVSIGAAVANFVFWTFGFLRMGMTGLTSQARGANDLSETRLLLARSVLIGGGIGALLMLSSTFVISLALRIMDGSSPAEALAGDYLNGRFWGAPAALAVYAVNGWLLGLGRTGAALALQIIMNVANATFDIVLVTRYGMGPEGVGFGTAAAEWTALIVSIPICLAVAGRLGGDWSVLRNISLLLARKSLVRMFAVNADIMVRTIALLILFTWFTNSGARQGDVMLAANHILSQIMAISAFVLDAFAFTAEERVGASVGARNRARFWRSVRLTSEFAVGGGLLLALTALLCGGMFIDLVTTQEEVRQAARTFLPLTALIAFIGAPSWMLDGIFIGATRSAAMRNAAIISTTLYILLDLSLRGYGNWGVWIAIVTSYVLRAGSLGAFMPGLVKTLNKNSDKHETDMIESHDGIKQEQSASTDGKEPVS